MSYPEILSTIHQLSSSINLPAPRVVAVSKYQSLEKMQQLFSLGQRDFGENRVEEMSLKQTHFNDQAMIWHFIGRIQSNKIKKIVHLSHFIHSVSKEEHLLKISHYAKQQGKNVSLFLQVNTTNEPQKDGFPPDFKLLSSLLKEALSLPYVKIHGLMTLGPTLADPLLTRASFQTLSRLKQELESVVSTSLELSMGMSLDFQCAIEEGSSILRIGRALFEALT